MSRAGFVFTVKGMGAFPLDMLRYDGCWPSSSDDVNLIHESLDRKLSVEEVIKVRGVELRSNDRPTGDRWSSFGWSVSAVRKTI